MDRSSTVARFIQRFREAAPVSPNQRRRDRQAMEAQFWWAQHSFSNINSEDGDFKTDRSGCGASPPPPQPTQDGDGTIHIINSNHDLEDSRSRERAPPPPYGYREQTYFNLSEHKTLEASCNHAAPQDERNTDQTTLVSSLLSPTCSAATGPPGPPSGDGDRPRSVDGDGFHQPTVVVGEAEVAELAASLLAASLPEYQAASSSLGASSGRLPERPVDATRKNAMRTSIEGEGCDELANLDARAGSLLEHCRQLLSAPPTDDAEQLFQEATHPLPDPYFSGERSSAVAPLEDGASSHNDEDHTHERHTRQGLEQRARVFLDNWNALEEWEAGLHGLLVPTGANSDFSPVCSNRYDQAARETISIEGLALAKTTEVGTTHVSTLREKTISGLDGGESRAWCSNQALGENEATGDEGSDSRSLLLLKEFPTNRAARCMGGVNDEAFNRGRSTGLIQHHYGRGMALPELTSATGDLLTGVDSVLRQFTEDEKPLSFEDDDPVNVRDLTNFRRCCRMTHTSSAKPSWASRVVKDCPQEDVSAMTPSARGGKQDDSSLASLKVFAEDPIIVALLARAHEIEVELERRRLLGIDANQLL